MPKIVLTIVLFLLASFASAETNIQNMLQDGTAKTPDYMVSFIDAEPGQTVDKEWQVHHKYFERVLGWDKNDFCDAVRLHNPQFAHIFTDQNGENNPGFRKMPLGRWNMPVPFSATSVEHLNLQERLLMEMKTVLKLFLFVK